MRAGAALFGPRLSGAAAASSSCAVEETALFTDASGATVVVLDEPPRCGWVVVEPWAPVDVWEYGESVAELAAGAGSAEPGDRPEKSAGGVLGWPRLLLRRRRWRRAVLRVAVPLAGPLATRVLGLSAAIATSEAKSTQCAEQLHGLQHEADDAEARANQAKQLSAELAAVQGRTDECNADAARCEFLCVASRNELHPARLAPTPLSARTANRSVSF